MINVLKLHSLGFQAAPYSYSTVKYRSEPEKSERSRVSFFHAKQFDKINTQIATALKSIAQILYLRNIKHYPC